MTPWKRLAAVLALCAVMAPPAAAQLRIGQTAGHSGTVAAGVKESTDGARLYFDAVNARGGVNGQRVELVSLDDHFEVPMAEANAKQLIQQGVLALFLTRGTPHNQAILPLLAEFKLPLVGPATGAKLLHEPVNPWVFNVRASYQREAERVVKHLHQVGLNRVGVVQVDDSFGADAMAGVQRGFDAAKQQAVLHAKYDRNSPDFAPIVPKLVAADAQAVIFIGSGTAVVSGMKALRAAGSKAQMVTLSNNASAGFVKSLGDIARGVVVSQVFPYERSSSVALVRELRELVAAKGAGEVTPALLEGFTAAKVMVEGLRRAGPAPTREKLRAALEGLRNFDLGGVELSYSPTDHSGLDYADLSIVTADGRFQR
ncbi:ABC-type branched-chain amino acid transport system, periplasmic component [Burkholderiales bacterium JOSHI_001]|nr:ABC-type branched-chain amino acid transport system, periplasmic component [Burkholderiales bacterium JOSHI_001]